LHLDQRRNLFDARRTPGCPKIQYDNPSPQLIDIQRLLAVGDLELRGLAADAPRMIAAIAAYCRQRKRRQQ